MTQSPKKKIDNPLFAPTALKEKRKRDSKGRYIPLPKEPMQTTEELADVRDDLLVENRVSNIISSPIIEPNVIESTTTQIDSIPDNTMIQDISSILASNGPNENVDNIMEKGGNVLNVIEEMEQQLADTQGFSNTLQNDIITLRKEVSKLRITKESLSQKLDDARGEIITLVEVKDRFSKVEQDLRIAEDKYLTAQKELEFLQSEKKNLEFELHGAKSQVRELERANSEISDETRGLKEKVVLLEEIQINMEQVIQKKNREMERIPSLEAELDAVTTSRDALDLDMRTCKKVLSKMREEMEVLETQLVTTVQERDSLVKKFASSESENIESMNRIQSLARELGQARSEKKNQDSELVVLKKWVGDIHNKLVATKARTSKIGVNDGE